MLFGIRIVLLVSMSIHGNSVWGGGCYGAYNFSSGGITGETPTGTILSNCSNANWASYSKYIPSEGYWSNSFVVQSVTGHYSVRAQGPSEDTCQGMNEMSKLSEGNGFGQYGGTWKVTAPTTLSFRFYYGNNGGYSFSVVDGRMEPTQLLHNLRKRHYHKLLRLLIFIL